MSVSLTCVYCNYSSETFVKIFSAIAWQHWKRMLLPEGDHRENSEWPQAVGRRLPRTTERGGAAAGEAGSK